MRTVAELGASLALVCFGLSAVTLEKTQSDCTGPRGKPGSCLPIDKCHSLNALLQNIHRSAEETALLILSQCGLEGKRPRVCCEDACTTPDGTRGECLDINKCESMRPILNLPRPLQSDILAYVRESICEDADGLSVCCGGRPPSVLDRIAVNPEDLLPTREECGYHSGEDRIVGGSVTSVDNYPWLALVERQGSDVFCGATLISRRYLLTAAHCYVSEKPPLSIRLGEYNIRNEGPDCEEEAGGFVCTDGAISIPIETFTPHPHYNLDKTGKNDIAIVRMTQDAPDTRYIGPICLPVSDPTVDKAHFIVAGWGLTEMDSVSEKKRHVVVPLVDGVTCDTMYRSRAMVSIGKRQLCAGEPGKDSCNGDSGGPLMTSVAGQHELAGLVSFGTKKCGSGLLPGVYTNIFPYLDWIRSQLRP